jgi:hypothetical protein
VRLQVSKEKFCCFEAYGAKEQSRREVMALNKRRKTMPTKTHRFVSIALIVGLLLAASPSFAETLSVANVANLTTVNLFTVPVGQKFIAKSMIVANSNASTSISCCARLYRNSSAMTGFVTVQGGNTVQIQFDPPVVFDAGDIVAVRNGASAGVLHFTVVGNRDFK